MPAHDTYFVMRIQNVLTQIPTISAVLVGFYVSWISRRRHPQVATLTALALGLILVAVIGMRIMPYLAARQEADDVNEVMWRMFVISLVGNATTATGLVLLLWAAFGWRRPDNKRK
jgi:predicted solute-binding protein